MDTRLDIVIADRSSGSMMSYPEAIGMHAAIEPVRSWRSDDPIMSDADCSTADRARWITTLVPHRRRRGGLQHCSPAGSRKVPAVRWCEADWLHGKCARCGTT